MMTRWADGLTSLWMLLVAVIYFGGFFSTRLGNLTVPGSAGYAAMLLISVATALAGKLSRAGTPSVRRSSHTESDHG